jgi:hypothetical protein
MLWFDTSYSYTVKVLDGAGRLLDTHGPIAARTQPLPASGYPPTMGWSTVWALPVSPSHPTSPRSAEFVNYLASKSTNANMTTRAYGVPVFEAEANDPVYGPFTCAYGCNIGKVQIPPYAGPDPGSDAHMAVLSSDGLTEWDFFKPVKNTSGAWTGTSAGVTIDIQGSGIVPANLGGANAANFALLGGLIRPEEIAAGRISHALALGIPGIASGRPACPATKNVGVNGGVIPEGTRFQLDPSLNVAALGLSVWEQVVARALQTYGGYVRDNSGVVTVYAETSSPTTGGRRYDGWAKAGAGINSGTTAQTFSSKFPWSSLRALDFTYC